MQYFWSLFSLNIHFHHRRKNLLRIMLSINVCFGILLIGDDYITRSPGFSQTLFLHGLYVSPNTQVYFSYFRQASEIPAGLTYTLDFIKSNFSSCWSTIDDFPAFQCPLFQVCQQVITWQYWTSLMCWTLGIYWVAYYWMTWTILQIYPENRYLTNNSN